MKYVPFKMTGKIPQTLVPRSIIPTLPPTAPTQISNNDTSNDEAQMMQKSATSSIEAALSSRSEGSDKD